MDHVDDDNDNTKSLSYSPSAVSSPTVKMNSYESSKPSPPPRRSSKRSLRFLENGDLHNDNGVTSLPPAFSPTTKIAAPKSMSSLGGGGSSVHSSSTSAAKKLYRSSGGGDSKKFVTRDIAALDFLLGIPLANESELVRTGWRLQQQQYKEDEQVHEYSETDYPSGSLNVDALNKPIATSHGTWWEKHVRSFADFSDTQRQLIQEGGELERPTNGSAMVQATRTASGALLPVYTPGRRLDGDEAVRIQVPLTTDNVKTRQRAIARLATLREWERNTAHGVVTDNQEPHPPLLDGRLFFSASGSYPISVFSMVRYEPRREQAEFRRKKLESLGGGGSQFIMPTRDWRGISYRALLPRPRNDKKRENAYFNRFLHGSSPLLSNASGSKEISAAEDDDNSTSSDSSDDSDVYVPGLLDDPGMAHGRHRNCMIGDHVTGPIVSSTIQFVKPAILKAELNKQFRERFDGWEPPREARKYIGAYVSVPDGKYVLKDPTSDDSPEYATLKRTRQESVTSMSTASESHKEKTTSTLRIPPSLTLSKIRSLKQQALQAAVNAQLEVSTVALACVYFERLCLDCRVDKSNRRLTFASCLLLASKINEPNVRLVMQQQDDQDNEKSRFQSLIRPNKRSSKVFESLLEFFAESWNLSIKTLFDAEFGVFAALGFSLHATPSQVGFHFRRLMKTLEWNPRDYLGQEMYSQWQDALKEEERRKRERVRRREIERQRKEEKLLDLQLELEHEVRRRQAGDADSHEGKHLEEISQHEQTNTATGARVKKAGGMKLFNRFGMRRIHSTEGMDRIVVASDHPVINHPPAESLNTGFPSMPVLPHHGEPATSALSGGIVAIEIPDGNESVTSSIGAADNEGIIL